MILRRLVVPLSLTLLLAACSTLGLETADPEVSAAGVATAAPAQPAANAAPGQAELLRFVAEEPPGAQAAIDDPRGGIRYVALIEREYISARGRLCKRVLLQRDSGGGAARQLACQGEEGWQLVRPLLGAAL